LPPIIKRRESEIQKHPGGAFRSGSHKYGYDEALVCLFEKCRIVSV
jgi:hypothetical protein